jgi:hypothetical protein
MRKPVAALPQGRKNGREHADSRAMLEKKHGLFEVRFDAR